jgi:hypothetical protein
MYYFSIMSSENKSGELKHGGTANKLCITRALRNVSFLRSKNPSLFPKGQPITSTGMSINELLQLHTIDPSKVNVPEVSAQLRTSKIPVPKSQAVRPLFNGTLYFVQIKFGNGSTTLNSADLGVAIKYASTVAKTIVAYSNPYGANIHSTAKIDVSTSPVQYTASRTSGYTDNDLQEWVDDIITTNNLQNACIMIMNDINTQPVNRDADPSRIGGYHSNTDAGNPYCFCNVYATPIDVADKQGAFALVASHEIAEMTVDPVPHKIENPEVCDACAPNCGTTYLDFFDSNNKYLGAGSSPTDSKFSGYAYYINSIVSSKFNLDGSGCITSGTQENACAYAPPT